MGGEAEGERLLTTQEVAEIFAVSPDTVKDWRIRWPGRGPNFIRIGGAIRYSQEALRSYIRGRTVQGGSDAGR